MSVTDTHQRSLAKLVQVERNVIVHASAGTGKTFSLVSTVVHMLAGVSRGAVPPGRLCAITFTEKAAAEMADRIRERVVALMDDPCGDELLRATAAKKGVELPGALHWRRVSRDLGAMVVTTFHGFCAQILRENPVEAGVDPGFELADELLAKTLLEETVEKVIYERLARGDGACLRALRALPVRRRAHGAALVVFVSGVLRRVREDGHSVEAFAARHDHPDPDVLAAEHAQRLRELDHQKTVLCALWARLGRSALGRGKAADKALYSDLKAFASEAASLQRRVEALPPEELGEHLALVARYARPLRRSARKARLLSAGPGFSLATLPTFQERYLEKMLQHTAQLLRLDFLEIISEVEHRYQDAKTAHGVLDFTDLLLMARATLRESTLVRKRLKRRFELLMVDEFQDTNDVQLEFISLLGEVLGDERYFPGGPAAVSKLRLASNRLFLVGDPKQSIYNFRGADVTVFERVRRRLVSELDLADELALQVNRRSVPGLIRFGNRWFREVLGLREVGDLPGTVRFDPEKDALVAHRESEGPGPVVEFLAMGAGSGPEAEAEAVARWIERFLAGGGDHPVAQRRCGDIAILLRQFRHLSHFQDALQRRQIPYFVVKGRGFYGCAEILDLHQALRFLLDPDDGLALVAILRSPLFLVSDAGLVWMQREVHGQQRGALSYDALLEARGSISARLDAEDLRALDAFFDLCARLLPELDRLGPRGVLQAVVELTLYREKLAGTFRGRQKIGNVEKLLELARHYELSTYGHLSSFEQRLAGLIEEEPREAEGQVVEESADVVRLMTIHQSKGLEFPVVMVPELHTMGPRRLSGDPVQYDRAHGLQVRQRVRHRGRAIADVQTEAYDLLRETAKAREDAEERRLVYVAATRARDLLWLSGVGHALRPDGTRSEVPRQNPLTTLQSMVFGEEPEIVETCRERHLDELMGEMPPVDVAPVMEREPAACDRADKNRWSDAMARSFTEVPSEAATPTLAVTQLGDFHRCPRRYFLWYVAGLRDEACADDARQSSQAGAEGVQAILDRGTAAHAALEHLDFDLYERSSAAQRAHLVQEELEAHDVWMTSEEVGEVTRAITASLAGSTLLATVADAQRRSSLAREVPFMLHLSDEAGTQLYLRGQIDLVIQGKDGASQVLDYKFSRASSRGLAPYLFQLQTYALAARLLTGEAGGGWSAGIVYLREAGMDPSIAGGDAADLDAFREGLPALARRLVQCRASNVWPQEDPEGQARSEEVCAAEGCDFRSRCFGSRD